MSPPTGTVTFLFTDIEGSTRLWEQYPAAMREALPRHDAILTAAIQEHKGYIVKGTGDGLYAAFVRPSEALVACLSAQQALLAEPRQALGEKASDLHEAIFICLSEKYKGAYCCHSDDPQTVAEKTSHKY